MKPTEPLPLYHSWPQFDRERHLGMDGLFDGREATLARLVASGGGEELANKGVGVWECDLADNRLRWSAGVYDLFGIPRGARITRPDAVALYSGESRAAMENLRAYAIRHGRGFTLDIHIRPVGAAPRWMRLSAVPIHEGRKIVRLQGTKRLI